MATKITRGQIGGIYAIAARLGWDNDRLHDTVYDNYHVEHISQLTAEQAAEFINLLQGGDPATQALNVWRKRLMAAVGAYLKSKNYEPTPDRIKATACRAAGMPNAQCFNHIPVDRLRSLYNAFCQRNRDMKEVKQMDADLTAAMAVMN